jgi:nitroreductase
MGLELGVDEVLTTTRTVRKRLDLEKPVPREVVNECLELAFQAPNGSNQQSWHWVLVDDPAIRAEMTRIYAAAMDDYIARGREQRSKETSTDLRAPKKTPEEQARMTESVMYLRQHMAEVPVLLVPAISGRMEGRTVFEQASRWGSILPAVWSFMLALRSRGLGSAWTTLTLHREQEMAELLGIPYERVTQAGMFPIAYTVGTEFKRADRSRSRDAIHWNHW